MTNNEIIYKAVENAFTPEQAAELVNACYTAQQIANYRAAYHLDTTDNAELVNYTLAADTFHTFAEWKRLGYSVKKGQHALLICNLWKYTDKPGKAALDAAAEAEKDAPETDPHFYLAKSHLFSFLQVEKAK